MKQRLKNTNIDWSFITQGQHFRKKIIRKEDVEILIFT